MGGYTEQIDIISIKTIAVRSVTVSAKRFTVMLGLMRNQNKEKGWNKYYPEMWDETEIIDG